jgi:hypothetical protein
MVTIQRLNMDNTWWLEVDGLRLLVDPWLVGAEIDFFAWFNKQWHRTAPADWREVPAYDLVLITQKYPDHYHEETLRLLQPKRLIVPTSLEKKVKALLPDADVMSLRKEHPTHTEKGVTIRWLHTSRTIDPIYEAVLIEGPADRVLIAPHGQPDHPGLPDKVSLLISPFNHYRLPFFLGGTVAPGLDGLRRLTKRVNPDHIVATHDEDKFATGLVTRLARVTRVGKADLKAFPELETRCLEVSDYNVVRL